MPILSSMDEAPKEFRFLFAQAANGSITPIEFCKALDGYGISEVQKLLYLRDAFGLPLEQAKRVLIETEYGSVDAWSEGVCQDIDGLSSAIEDSDGISNLGEKK
jgi:hypothetical protein